ERPRDVAGGQRGERSERRQGRAEIAEEQRPEEDCRGRAVEDEVVELDRVPEKARNRDAADLFGGRAGGRLAGRTRGGCCAWGGYCVAGGGRRRLAVPSVS